MRVVSLKVSESPLTGIDSGSREPRGKLGKRAKSKRVTLYRLAATLEDNDATFPSECDKRYRDFVHVQTQMLLAGCSDASSMGGGRLNT